MTLTLYTNTSDRKDVNKTLTTIGTYVAEPIAPTSITSPSVYITLPESTAGRFPGGNYAYIAEWGRYYYMDPPVWLSDGVWQVQLTCDVLMSHRQEIAAQSAYVARAESEYDTTITDTAAPVRAPLRQYIIPFEHAGMRNALSSWVSSGTLVDQTSMCVVVALNVAAYKLADEQDPDWKYSDTPYLYIVTSLLGYADLLNTLKRLGADILAGLTGTSNISGIVEDAYLLPFEPRHSTHNVTKIGMWVTQNLNPGSWDGITEYTLPTECYVLSKKYIAEHFWYADLQLPSSDLYLDVSPFASYSLVKYPLGAVDVDGRILTKQGSTCRLTISSKVDPLSGQCIFMYGVSPYGETKTIDEMKQICVHPLGETSVRMDYESVTVKNCNMSVVDLSTKVISTAARAVTAVQNMDFSAAASGAAQAAADFGTLATPTYAVSGSARSALYTDGAYLIMTCQSQLPIPEHIIGRPLYQVRTLGDLVGFVQVQDMHVENMPNAFADEVEQIENLLRSGVYM